MLNISKRLLNLWSDEMGVANPILVEQDLRLINILEIIYHDPYLSKWLCFKGGTALNKLYFQENSRLSIDLDFNVIGNSHHLFREIGNIRKRLTQKILEQDANYQTSFRYQERQTTLIADYEPLMSKEKQRIKIEMSTLENIPIRGVVKKGFRSPLTNKPIPITTYTLEELIATKVRALYGRLKGRDLYDLDLAQKFDLDKTALRKMVLFYFYRANKIFNYQLFVRNIQDKTRIKRFRDDFKDLIRTDTQFNITKAVRQFLKFYTFLKEYDEIDKKFLLLAKYLQGKISSKTKIAQVSSIKYPIKYLMQNINISTEAEKATIKDIELTIK